MMYLIVVYNVYQIMYTMKLILDNSKLFEHVAL